MDVTYEALTAIPQGCIQFYGITVLPPDEATSSETLCLVFARASEGTIVEHLKNKGDTLNWVDVVGLFVDSADALDAALHQKGLVHGLQPFRHQADLPSDLHANNVLVTILDNNADRENPTSYHSVLCDFGLGRRINDIPPDITVRDGYGPPYATAPEVMRGEAYDFAADLFSYGILLRDLTLFWMRQTGNSRCQNVFCPSL